MAIPSDQMPLGQETQYHFEYDPKLLFAIPRHTTREQLGIDAELPFVGEDIWNAYEFSWLNSSGKPVVACAEFRFACESPNIIESKSFKLYLNSFNQTRFDSIHQVTERLRDDLSRVAGAPVKVVLATPESWFGPLQHSADGYLLDDIDVEIEHYHPAPELLVSNPDEVVSETLHSHLLRSLCPVTGQPDWASVIIEYRGPAIDRAGLLQYIISFRQHQEFHEQCVERMFCDIQAQCQPERLSVYARYLRRGGLDINPMRSSEAGKISNPRFTRQ